MDNNTGGQSSSDLQRRAAAEIARKKVLAAYADRAQKFRQNQNQIQVTSTSQSSPVAVNNAHLKDTPVAPKINSESWKQYHSAWQDYYQKYYSEYYKNAARQYIAKQELKAAREQAEEDELLSALTKASQSKSESTGLNLNNGSAVISSGNTEVEAENSAATRLRKKIRGKAGDSAKKSRRRRRFIPLIAGLAVTLAILFLQYNRLLFAPLMAYVSPGNAPATEIEALDPTITQTVSSDPRLIIPKLNIDVPINFNIPLSDVMSAMNNGVAHYRLSGASAYPGEIGNFIITGHSAGDIYSSNPYKYIFSGLERLEDGDLIYVNYNSVRYTYQVVKKQVIEPTDVAALIVQTDKPLITLVTCTPLGTSRYRLLVTGEQISPAYDGSGTTTDEGNSAVINIDEATEMPANEPSFFERIWNWLIGN